MAVKQKEKKPLHLAKLKIKQGDEVLILTGKDKGKQGKVSRAMPQAEKVIVEGLNIVKKHVKPQGQNRQGGIIEKAMPIHISNVMLLCTSCHKPTRVSLVRRPQGEDKKLRSVRVCKQCGKEIQDQTRGS
jgi:large subunit ribosomal protein L24